MRDSPCREILPPRQRRQKYLMLALVDGVLGNPMSTAESLSLNMKPRLNRPVGGSESSEGWCHWRWQSALPVSATTWNLHTTQSNYFAPTIQWGCQSQRSWWKQRIICIVWKIEIVCSEVNENNDCSGRTWIEVDCIISVEERTGVHRFTSGVSPIR